MVLRRRWLRGAGAFLLVFVPLVGLVIGLPNVYESSTTILIERQQIPNELVKSTVTGPLEVRLSSINAQVVSRASLVRLIRCFGLYGFARKVDVCNERDLARLDLDPDVIPQAVIDQMRQEVNIETRGGGHQDGSTAAITIRYRGPQPQTVAEVANALAGSYLLENQRTRADQTAGTAIFLRREVDSLSRKLQDLDRQVWELKQGHLGGRPGTEVQLKAVAREYEVNYEAYKSLAARQMEAALSESMENVQKGEQFRVIERAVPSEDPIAPLRFRLYASALALALVVAFVVILLFGRRRADPLPAAV